MLNVEHWIAKADPISEQGNSLIRGGRKVVMRCEDGQNERNFPTLQHSHISTGTIKCTVPCSFDVSIEHLRYVTAAVLLKSVQFMKEVGSKGKMWRSGRLVAQSNAGCVTIPGRTNKSGCHGGDCGWLSVKNGSTACRWDLPKIGMAQPNRCPFPCLLHASPCLFVYLNTFCIDACPMIVLDGPEAALQTAGIGWQV